MNKPKNILWLASWYPNKLQPFNGDFIQRHARAAAIYDNIHVIHITGAKIKVPYIEEKNQVAGLQEQVIYFRKRNGFFEKLYNPYTGIRIYKKAIREYIKNNGLPYVVHVHIPWKAGLLALWIKYKYKTKFIVTEQWSIYNTVTKDKFSNRSIFFKMIIKEIYRQSEKFISVSKFLATAVNKIVIQKPFTIIPNVVDTNLFYYKEKHNNIFTFIHVSNMVPLKNVKSILDAFLELTKEKIEGKIQLILVGNSDNQYENYAEKLGLLNKNVFFKGEVPYEVVAQEMRNANAFILYSDVETFGCVVAEALCCGLPVIAANSGSMPELINEKNGLLVPLNDVLALKNAMLRLYMDFDLYDTIEISRNAINQYNFKTISSLFSDVYNNI